MTKLMRVSVQGLFGNVDHVVELSPSRPTVITGPNGTGKTHVLQLISAALDCNVEKLLWLPFRRVELTFTDRELIVEKQSIDNPTGADDERVDFTLVRDGDGPLAAHSTRRELERVRLEAAEGEAQRPLPRWIIPLESGAYYDTRVERALSRRVIESRYGRPKQGGTLDSTADGAMIRTVLSEVKCVLVDTKRLDLDLNQYDPRSSTGRARATEGEARIHRYIREIQGEIAAARNESLHRTQSADLRFADRALAAARLTVRIEELERRYAEVSALYEEMADNGLAPAETPTDLPDKPNPTAKRILSLLLQDWKDRLEPLIPINTKLNELRSILDSKLQSSGKRTYIGPRGTLGIRSTAGRPIPVARLSSGEQHLLAIFSQLLFATRPGSLVLVDEPEISMHMSWQHSFLKDVASVSEGSDLQVVVATHSTGIINGRWDLVAELQLPPMEEGPAQDLDESFDEDEETSEYA